MGDFHQHPVALDRTQRVVDQFEIDQVQVTHREPLLITLGLGHGLLQTVSQQHPVGQLGEIVVIGQMGDALFGPLAPGDVQRRKGYAFA